MRIKLFRVRSSVVVVIAAAWLAALAPAHGQRPAASAAKWTPDRTPDGQPDMQGIYNRSGVGGLDPGALEAQGHRPENPIDPSENNPLSVSNRPDGLANVDRGFGEAGSGARQRGPRRPGGIVDPPNKILPWKPEEEGTFFYTRIRLLVCGMSKQTRVARCPAFSWAVARISFYSLREPW